MSSICITRKYPLRGYCLAPPEGRGDRIGQQANVTLRDVTLRDVTLRDITDTEIRTERRGS